MANLTKPSATDAAAVKTAKPLTFLGTDALIAKSIESIKTRGESLSKSMHLTACSILSIMEIQRAGGTSADHANNLLAVLPKGIRKNALIDWFLDYGFMSYDAEKKKLYIEKGETKATQIVKAEATPFWEHKPEPEYKAYNLAEVLRNALKNALKAEEKHAGKNEIDAELLAALKAIVPAAPVKQTA